MTPDKLQRNLEKLRGAIARKPRTFTTSHARRLSDSFHLYTRTGTVNLTLSINDILREHGWPFPAYCPEYVEHFASGMSRFVNPTRYDKLVLWIEAGFERFAHALPWSKESTVDEDLTGHFDAHLKQLVDYWTNHSLLDGHQAVVGDVAATYRKGYWSACITTTFPLLDYVFRQLLKTRHLTRDITAILGVFRAAGVTSADLKPGYAAWEVAGRKGQSEDQATESDLRLVGIALGSFVDFASLYYAHYRTDSSSNATLNRHAIIHGSTGQCWSKANAARILSFLDLALRLEPAFSILFKED